jgi:hypothetical protein
MSQFGRAIHPHLQAELRAAAEAQARGQSGAAFAHLERAHVLGQASTVEHMRVHWRMLVWGLQQRNVRECLGQLIRIAGAATMTAVGLVPYGNTGGSNVSPFQRMPVAPELEALIQRAHSADA